MKYIKIFEYVMANQQLRNIISNLSVAPLYHALKSDRAIKALSENKLGGYSIQRIWEGGKKLKDDQPGYDESDFMRGISTSRDIDFCAKWNDIIFVFDQDKLRNKYKIEPYNWGNSIGRGYIQKTIKREREEFVITGYSKSHMINPKTGKKYKNDWKRLDNFSKMIENPNGYIEPLDKYLIGFFISERVEKYIDEKDKAILKSHKKYLGVYEN